MIVYVKTNCPYSAKVLAAAEKLGIRLEKRNIADFGIIDELIARGGRQQVPYLWDPETSQGLYESDLIVKYLEDVHAH